MYASVASSNSEILLISNQIWILIALFVYINRVTLPKTGCSRLLLCTVMHHALKTAMRPLFSLNPSYYERNYRCAQTKLQSKTLDKFAFFVIWSAAAIITWIELPNVPDIEHFSAITTLMTSEGRQDFPKIGHPSMGGQALMSGAQFYGMHYLKWCISQV